MRAKLLGVMTVFLMFLAVFLTSGIGVGAAIHWLLPAVSFETAVLIGCLTVPLTMQFCFQISAQLEWMSRFQVLDQAAEAEDDDDAAVYPLPVAEPRSITRRRKRPK